MEFSGHFADTIEAVFDDHLESAPALAMVAMKAALDHPDWARATLASIHAAQVSYFGEKEERKLRDWHAKSVAQVIAVRPPEARS